MVLGWTGYNPRLGVPLSYHRDEASRRIRLTAVPPFTSKHAVHALYRQAAETTWQYATLVDLRRAVLDAEGIAELLAHMRELVARHGVRGPIALVAWESASAELLRAYADDVRLLAYGAEVFQNTSDAERWLERFSSAPPPGPKAS